MDVVKTASSNPEGLQRCSDVLLDPGFLTQDPGSDPNSNLFVEAVPHNFGGH